MGDKIFEIVDKTGREIYLSKERWKHIQIEHPNVIIDEIILALQKPIKIVDKINKRFYYQYFKNKKTSAKYLRVIVKYLNKEGFVITAYFMNNAN